MNAPANRSRGPELLVDLIATSTAAMVEAGLDRGKAEGIAKEIAERMAAEWGGQCLYFPQGLALKLSRRDAQIYAEFTGSNHAELARKYHVSVQWIYKIVKSAAKAESARQQIELFR